MDWYDCQMGSCPVAAIRLTRYTFLATLEPVSITLNHPSHLFKAHTERLLALARHDKASTVTNSHNVHKLSRSRVRQLSFRIRGS